MDIQAKANILRQHEICCYQICYYLTQNDHSAAQAACKALLEVACDPDFFIDNAEEQKNKIKRASIHASLHKEESA